MKCPFCGKELNVLVQSWPKKYNLPDVILYDHNFYDEEGKNIDYPNCPGNHHTKTASGWENYYKSLTS